MIRLCDASRSILIVVDFQERLMPAIHEGSAVVRNALTLAQAARILGVPIIGTAQNPAGLGPNLPDLHAMCDKVIAKTDFDACAEPDFLAALDPGRDELVVVGCEAHVCVLQTVLGLLARNRSVRVVADAVGSRKLFNKATALKRASAAGADIVSTEMVVFEWLRNSEHPQFRQVHRLIR